MIRQSTVVRNVKNLARHGGSVADHGAGPSLAACVVCCQLEFIPVAPPHAQACFRERRSKPSHVPLRRLIDWPSLVSKDNLEYVIQLRGNLRQTCTRICNHLCLVARTMFWCAVPRPTPGAARRCISIRGHVVHAVHCGNSAADQASPSPGRGRLSIDAFA